MDVGIERMEAKIDPSQEQMDAKTDANLITLRTEPWGESEIDHRRHNLIYFKKF
jgi:hypothetical protein